MIFMFLFHSPILAKRFFDSNLVRIILTFKLYGEDIFEQIYDIHLKVMNQDLYEELPKIRAEKKKTDEEKREYERRSREERQKQWIRKNLF